MTSLSTSEPLETLPMPAGALELPAHADGQGPRSLAVEGLRQALAERRLELPLGPATALEDPQRLLSLNRFGMQLATAGMSADQIVIDPSPWAEAATAPQLLLAALVDEENAVVWFPGVLTGAELLSAAQDGERNAAGLLLDTTAFSGGIDRLFTLVQLLEPEALPRLALNFGMEALRRQVVAVGDWLSGQVDGALQQLFGAQWQPLTEGAFRSGEATTLEPDALALVAIPLGLDGQQLVCGHAVDQCIEHFTLQIIATGRQPEAPDGLVLRLAGAMAGDLLPDGLGLTASQGGHSQQQVADGTSVMTLVFQGGQGLIDVRLSYPGSADLVLPPLQLPG